MTLRTRHYAKRQRTWMRRLPGLEPVAGDRDPAEIAAASRRRLTGRREHDAVREARDAMVLLVDRGPGAGRGRACSSASPQRRRRRAGRSG